jgi:excisionase family DNA binding protein
MTAARGCRAVVVLGTATGEVEGVLMRLGLAPLDDDSGEATIWLPAGRTTSPLSQGPPGYGALPDPLLLSIAQVGQALGVGRTKVYELISRGQLEVVHLGRAARVPASAVNRLVQSLGGGNQGCPTRSVPRARLRSVGSPDRSQRIAAP